MKAVLVASGAAVAIAVIAVIALVMDNIAVVMVCVLYMVLPVAYLSALYEEWRSRRVVEHPVPTRVVTIPVKGKAVYPVTRILAKAAVAAADREVGNEFKVTVNFPAGHDPQALVAAVMMRAENHGLHFEGNIDNVLTFTKIR